MRVLFQIILVLWCGMGYAQEDFVEICSDSCYCSPSLTGALKPRGFEYKHEWGNVRIKGKDEVDALNQLTIIKVKVPLVVKESFTAAIGFNYAAEDYSFSNTSELEALQLNDNDFKSYNFNVYLLKPKIGNKYWSLRLSGGVAGNYRRDVTDYLKTSVGFLYGIKKSDTFIWGVGAAYRYSVGNHFAAPFIYYNKALNRHWHLEFNLPVRVRMNYRSINEKNVFEMETRVSGGAYGLNDRVSGLEDDVYRTTDINYLISYQREIYDFLWFSVYGGLKQNFRSRIFGSEFRVARNFVGGFSVFLVPPRKWRS